MSLSVCLDALSVSVLHTHKHIDASKTLVIYLYRRYAAQFGSQLATIEHLSIHLFMVISSWCDCALFWTTIICILLCITTHHIQSPYYWIMNKFYKWSTKRRERERAMSSRMSERKMEQCERYEAECVVWLCQRYGQHSEEITCKDMQTNQFRRLYHSIRSTVVQERTTYPMFVLLLFFASLRQIYVALIFIHTHST